MVSGSLSLSLSECFSPFLHSTGSLSVSWECLALPDGPGGFAQDSSCPALLRIPLGPFYGASFQKLLLTTRVPRRGPTTPHVHCYTCGLGWSPFARHYLGNHCLFSFPPGTKMFQFPGLALCVCRVTVLQTAGLSHSEIPGSMVICTYPGLIAAYHVLHRLHEPRHPPCALYYFLYDIRLNRSYFQLY